MKTSHSMIRPLTLRTFIFPALVASSLLPHTVSASNITWSGGGGAGDVRFLSGTNWVGGVAPANSQNTDIAVFTGAVTATQPKVSTDRLINGLVFSTPTGGWTLSGTSTLTSGLTIGGSGIDASLQTSGTTTISTLVTVGTGVGAWRVGSGGTLVISGAMLGGTSGAMTLGATGANGTIVLNGTSNRAATTNLVGGGSATLLLGNDTALGTGTAALAAGGDLIIGSSGGTRTIANQLNLASNLTISGVDDMNFTGTVNIASSSILFTINNSKTTFTTIDTNPNGTTSGLSRTANFLGTGTAVLVGDMLYTGATNINGGNVQIGNGGTTGSVSSVGGIVTSGSAGNGVLLFNRSNAYNYSGAISGGGQLKQIGAGTTILTGTNTYSGSTTISAGVLQIGNSGTTGSIASTGGVNITGSSAALAFNRSDSYTYGGVIGGSGQVQQLGSGTTILTGSNSYAGTTTISGGVLRLGSAASLPTVSAVAINGGALDLQGYAASAASLAFSGVGSAVDFTLGTNTATRLTITGAVNLTNGNLAFNDTPNGTVGKYTLISGSTLTGSAIGGAAPTNYRIGVTSSEVDLVHLATISLSPVVSNTNVHVGGSTTVNFTLANTAPTNSDSLSYSFNGVNGSSALSGSTSTTVSTSVTTVAGVTTVSGTAASTGSYATTNSTQTASATVTGYNLAAAATTASVNVGAVLAGTSKSAALALTNTAADSGGYTETLSTTGTNGLTSGFTFSGAVSGLAAGATDSSIQVGLDGTLTAGHQSGSVALGLRSSAVNGSGLGNTALTRQTVTITGDVYDAANLAQAATSTAGSVDTFNVSNLANSSALRAAANVTNVALNTSATGFTATTPGLVASGATQAGIASFDTSNKLNGTYTASANITATSTTATGGAISGVVANDASKNIGLTETVSGNVAAAGVTKIAGIAAGGSFTGYNITSTGLQYGTKAELLGGTASADTTVSVKFDTAAHLGVTDSASRVSDIVSISGMHAQNGGITPFDNATLTDQFVIQLSYTGDAAGYVAWYDSDLNKFVNAIAGNSTALGGSGLINGSVSLNQGNTAYNAAIDDVLGYYGYDASTNTAWAVLDHNSDLTVLAVPEPGTWAMLVGGFGTLIGMQRMRRRSGI